jgi:cell division protein FtsX
VAPFQLEGHLIGVLGFFLGGPIPVRRTFDWCIGFLFVDPFQLEGHLIGVLGLFLGGPIPVYKGN